MPWPHAANVTPKVQGIITQAGRPLPDVSVRVASGVGDDPCAGKGGETKTRVDGSFEIEPVTEVRFLVVMMGHAFIPWNLCYRDEAAWTLLASEKEYSLVDTGPIGVQVVACDIGDAEKAVCDIEWKEE